MFTAKKKKKSPYLFTQNTFTDFLIDLNSHSPFALKLKPKFFLKYSFMIRKPSLSYGK